MKLQVRRTQKSKTVLLILAFLLVVVITAITNQISAVAIAILGGWVVYTLWKNEMLALIVWMLAITNFLEFISISKLPYLQIVAGIRLNFADVLWLILLVKAYVKNNRRSSARMFSKQIAVWIIVLAFLYAAHFLLGNVTLDLGVNYLRVLIGYLAYIAIIGIIDTPKRLKTIIKAINVILIASVAIQVLELGSGQRITLAQYGIETTKGYYSETKTIQVSGESIPYFWNRAWPFSQIGLFISLSILFISRGRRRILNGLIIVAGYLGILIQLVRQKFTIAAISTFIVIVMAKQKMRVMLLVIIILMVMYGASSLLRPIAVASYNKDPLLVWQDRMTTIINPEQEGTYVFRMIETMRVYELWKNEVLIGYGPGQFYHNNRGIDVGYINALLMFGVIGLFLFLYMWLYVIVKGYKLIKSMPMNYYRAVALGSLAFLCGAFIQTMFGASYLQSGYEVGLVMAILDRSALFSKALEKQKLLCET